MSISSRRNDGTNHSRLTRSRASVATSAAGSRTTSSGTITDGVPCSSGPKISQIESTKLSAVFWQLTSSRPNG